MLVLTRKVNDSIVIDGNIVVRILGRGKGTVKLGIEAPKEVHIVRGELKNAKDKEKTVQPKPIHRHAV